MYEGGRSVDIFVTATEKHGGPFSLHTANANVVEGEGFGGSEYQEKRSLPPLALVCVVATKTKKLGIMK